MNNLKALRKKNNLTQQQMADIFSIQRPTYTRYENGERQPDFELLIQIAGYFGVSTDYLLGYEEKYEEKPKTKDEKEIESIIENTISDLESSDGLMFDGVPATEEEIEQIKAAMRIGLAMAKEKAREKFTAHKYRKKKTDSQEEKSD